MSSACICACRLRCACTSCCPALEPPKETKAKQGYKCLYSCAYILINCLYESLVIWGGTGVTGQRQEKNLSDWTRSGVHAFWHAQDGTTRLLFTDYQSATYEYIEYYCPADIGIHQAHFSTPADGSCIIYSREKWEGWKKESFSFVCGSHRLAILRLSSKRS